MECAEVMRLFSAAEDGERVSAGAIALANAHCDHCEECAVFRATLLVMRATPAPTAPESLVDRIIAASLESAATAVAAPEAPPATEDPTPAPAAPAGLVARGLHRPGRTITLRWTGAAAAAVVLIAIGVTSAHVLGGVRMAAVKDGTTSLQSDGSYAGSATAESAADMAPSAAEDTGEPGARADVATAADDASLIIVGGVVYELTEATTPEPSELATIGVTTSSLAAEGMAATHTVYSTGDDTTCYVRHDGRYLGFVRVSRTFGGTEYVLVTDAALTRFGEWPTLPVRFSQPVTVDGSPVFRLAGFDDRGVNVYRDVAGIESGIAIAPNTSSDDPAHGNPGWTWWEPAR